MRKITPILLAVLLLASCTDVIYIPYVPEAEDTVVEYVETRTACQYALYVLDVDGYIKYSDLCTNIKDFVSVDAYYARRKMCFEDEVEMHQGKTDGEPWKLLADGYIYEEPEP
jgi:hypothetical protein